MANKTGTGLKTNGACFDLISVKKSSLCKQASPSVVVDPWEFFVPSSIITLERVKVDRDLSQSGK